MFNYAERRRRLSDRMRAEGVDILFLGLSADLEYLSGVERGIPFFGQSSYAHGWVAGAFFRPDIDPVFVLPRMVAAFDLPVQPVGKALLDFHPQRVEVAPGTVSDPVDAAVARIRTALVGARLRQ